MVAAYVCVWGGMYVHVVCNMSCVNASIRTRKCRLGGQSDDLFGFFCVYTCVRKKNYISHLFVKNTKKSTCVKVDYTTELQFNNRCRRHLLRLQLRV